MGNSVAAGTFKALADEEQKHIECIKNLMSAMEKGQVPSSELGASMEKEGFFLQRAHS